MESHISVQHYEMNLSRKQEIHYFKGNLVVKRDTSSQAKFISDDENSLFYRVPKKILSFIDGCPSLLTQVEIGFDEDSERVILVIPN